MNPVPSLCSEVPMQEKILNILSVACHQANFRIKNSLNRVILLNKSRTFEDIQIGDKDELTEVGDKRGGAR